MENESQWIQLDPRNIPYTKRNVPPGPYKQFATPPRRRYQVSWATPWQETYLAPTNIRKTETTRNHPDQNVLITQKVKLSTSNKLPLDQTILNPICTYGIEFWCTVSNSNI
jgi:hypothetical protein